MPWTSRSIKRAAYCMPFQIKVGVLLAAVVRHAACTGRAQQGVGVAHAVVIWASLTVLL